MPTIWLTGSPTKRNNVKEQRHDQHDNHRLQQRRMQKASMFGSICEENAGPAEDRGRLR
jgi:hypothetical protein